MSGQPAPPLFLEAFASNAPVCTPASPIVGGKTVPLPTASQIGVINGAASLNDGFPPLTMTSPLAGGAPPFGVDMNGILYLLSAHIAALQAGQPYQWNSVLEAAMHGYAIGSMLQQANDLLQFWINSVDGNNTDPDLGGGGWYSTKPLYAASALAAGATNNLVLPGLSDYYLDLSTAAGNANITGFVAQRDGQQLYITNTGANALVINALNAGSAAGNQIRAATNIGIIQNETACFKYSTGAGKWLVV
jgi:hypothetical protein